MCRRFLTEWLELFCFHNELSGNTHELPRSRTAILPDKSVRNCAGSCAVVQPKLCEPQEEEEILSNQEAIGEAAGNTEEEEILFDQEAIGEEESRKKNLALKVKEMMRLLVLFICLF